MFPDMLYTWVVTEDCGGIIAFGEIASFAYFLYGLKGDFLLHQVDLSLSTYRSSGLTKQIS